MKKLLQFSTLLFIAALAIALSPAFVSSAHASALHNVNVASAHSAIYSAQATSPAPQSQPAAQPQSQTPPPNNQNPNAGAPPSETQGRRLPKTASPLPELALIGFLSLLGIVVIRRVVSNLI